MSLRDAKMPTLKDKIEEAAQEADKLREKKEKEDEKAKLIIKKKSNKK